jgi:hypothetical protein
VAVAAEPAHQLGRRHDVGELPLGEVAPLALGAENIAHGDVGAAGIVESGDHVRPDKTGPAGHQQHEESRSS